MEPPPSAAAAAAAAVSSVPSSSTAAVSPVVSLVVRIITFICLLISTVILATNSVTGSDLAGRKFKFKFNDLYVYRYMLSSAIIGIAYTLLQTAFTIYQLSTRNRIGDGDFFYQLDFYGDKGISYLLATGAAAGFGFTVDVNRVPVTDSAVDDFLDKANASASILLVGFLFSAVSSVFSSLSLPKKGT